MQLRPRHITLRVTAKEAERILFDAYRVDGSVSAYLRRLIRDDQIKQDRRLKQPKKAA